MPLLQQLLKVNLSQNVFPLVVSSKKCVKSLSSNFLTELKKIEGNDLARFFDIWYQDTFSVKNLSLRMKWQTCTVDLQLSINACSSQQKLVKNAQKISGYSEHVADKCHVTLSFSHCKCQSILTFSFSGHANVQSRDLTKENYLTLTARSI